jgi:hypothetical protein
MKYLIFQFCVQLLATKLTKLTNDHLQGDINLYIQAKLHPASLYKDWHNMHHGFLTDVGPHIIIPHGNIEGRRQNMLKHAFVIM